MCTVTFIPLQNNDFILTSNRDEHRLRETVAPQKYTENGVEMVFPKDKKSGGTWIGTSSKNRLVCVLNGAFEKHKKKNIYRKSRGLIAKEILKSENFEKYIIDLNLKEIEPFTMIIVDWNNTQLQCFELIWDEKLKYFNKMNNEPKIWSSSTLYEASIKELRKKWFNDWQSSEEKTSESMLKFHHLEKGPKEQSILMYRPNIQTVSVTQVQKITSKITIYYEDVVHENSIKTSV